MKFGRISSLAKKLCFFLGLFLVISLLALAVFGGLKLALYRQEENAFHLNMKAEYLSAVSQDSDSSNKRPNIVLLVFDDLGYGDFGYTGNRAIKTPNIDQVAENGVVLTNYYAPAAVCTPSRAGMLTGRIPARAGLSNVVFPKNSIGDVFTKLKGDHVRIPADEITLANVLAATGYKTGMIGKWHLGDHSPSLPNDMGFQSFFGSIYSNDMKPFAIHRNTEVEIAAPADQSRLNEWYSAEAERFIKASNGEPFFLYFAHNFPHIPLHITGENAGRSAGGLYGDVVESLDDVVGELVKVLKENNAYENTILLITSDNGPWLEGDAGPIRGRKGSVFDGGMKVPMIVQWPEKLSGGREIDGISMGIDLFPTILDWLDIPLPGDRIIDGKNIGDMLLGTAGSPHDYLYAFSGDELETIRNDRYKYYKNFGMVYTLGSAPLGFRLEGGEALFDYAVDNRESYNIAKNNQTVTLEMRAAFNKKVEEFKENRRGWLLSK